MPSICTTMKPSSASDCMPCWVLNVFGTNDPCGAEGKLDRLQVVDEREGRQWGRHRGVVACFRGCGGVHEDELVSTLDGSAIPHLRRAPAFDHARLAKSLSSAVPPEYAASSSMEHAGKLQGALLLIVGELDTNVDPSSTMQVVNKLILASKDFDLLVVPNGGHTNGGAYGDRKRYDFFVRHLQGRTPPSWNSLPPPNTGGGDANIGILDEDAMPWARAEDWDFELSDYVTT